MGVLWLGSYQGLEENFKTPYKKAAWNNCSHLRYLCLRDRDQAQPFTSSWHFPIVLHKRLSQEKHSAGRWHTSYILERFWQLLHFILLLMNIRQVKRSLQSFLMWLTAVISRQMAISAKLRGENWTQTLSKGKCHLNTHPVRCSGGAWPEQVTRSQHGTSCGLLLTRSLCDTSEMQPHLQHVHDVHPQLQAVHQEEVKPGSSYCNARRLLREILSQNKLNFNS